jgi:hypothetical protein
MQSYFFDITRWSPASAIFQRFESKSNPPAHNLPQAAHDSDYSQRLTRTEKVEKVDLNSSRRVQTWSILPAQSGSSIS